VASPLLTAPVYAAWTGLPTVGSIGVMLRTQRRPHPLAGSLLLGLLAAGAPAFAQQEPGAGDAPADEAAAPKHTNRLAKEQSPYLLQHAHNPVDWYPWGEEAFAKAKAENKPIFLSIGYAACHWCHVMERESFQDEGVARLLNDLFVPVKVDREERPDVDDVYMTAVQAMTGSGGWPLSVWLTPEGKPFYGGTYFPQPARFGRPSFSDVLRAISGSWAERRGELEGQAEKLSAHVAKVVGTQGEPKELKVGILDTAFKQLRASFDPEDGGFGRGPTKFPMPHTLSFLLRYHARTGTDDALQVVVQTLDAMAEGGLRDHLAGGFHRYSTDREWAIPHFEKMLYDQAGLVRAYTEAFQITGEERHARVARETLDFVLERMRTPRGAFTSSWDADSEGGEGRFYVWTLAQVRAALTPDEAAAVAARYGVTEAGNWTEEPGLNHLRGMLPLAKVAKRLGKTPAEVEALLATARAKLLKVRRTREAPLHDDKVLTDWNGLMIGACAVAARGLGEPRYAQAGAEAAEFVLSKLRPEGRLLHRWRGGEAGIPAMLEDYAFLAWGLIELFEATQEVRWLSAAGELLRAMQPLWDAKAGGYFQSRAGLIAKSKPTYDGAIPSGNAAAALALLRYGHLTGEGELWDRGQATLRYYSNLLSHHGGGSATLGLTALDLLLGPTREVVLAGAPDAPEVQAARRAFDARFLPRTAFILRPPGAAAALVAKVPFVKAQAPGDTPVTVYVCERYACKAPVTSAEAALKLLGGGD
jgi:uncharacterized protein YyaL (SSP411 family)